MEPELKKQLLNRLRRLEGQVAAVRRMVDEDTGCVEVLLQISAVQGALNKVGQQLLTSHVHTCVADAVAHGSVTERDAAVGELMDVLGRYVKGRA